MIAGLTPASLLYSINNFILYTRDMKFKELYIKVWNWHGWIGKVLTCFCVGALLAGLLGLALGVTKCKKDDEVIYTNTFLGETVELHDSNYLVTVNNAQTFEEITIKNKKDQDQTLNGHFIKVVLTISQDLDSIFKTHKFDADDFKLKSHTGVYIPLNDIGSLVGWDMIDYHWDQAKNGFLISSAKFSTKKAVKDYSLIKGNISPGESKDLTIYFSMDKQYDVENQIMVLEVDLRFSWNSNSRDRGEDIILLPRPENLKD